MARSLGPREGRVSHVNTTHPSHKARTTDGTQLAIETEHIVDVASVLMARENYKKGDYVVYKARLDDLEINAEFYPQGMQKSKPNYCAFFITIPNVKEDDKRKLSCRIGSVYELFDESFNPVNIWKSGRGYSSFATIDHLEKDPRIPVTLKLYTDPLFIATTKKSFQSQLHKMYQLSLKNGDILLSVITDGAAIGNALNPHSDSVNARDLNGHSEGLGLGEPPKKKRKTDNAFSDNPCSGAAGDDVPLITQTMRVSSLILQSGSKVFDQMLTTEMVEKSSKTITVFANSVQDVDDMVYFLATDILRKTADALSVIRLAHFYEIDRLTMACLNRMIDTLSIDTFVRVVNTFDRYSIEHGYNTLVQYGKTHCNEIKNREDYDELTHCFKCIVLGAAKD